MDDIGILTKAFMLIGHPMETQQYYQELSSYLTDLSPDEIRISFLTPFPGTRLWEKYKDQIIDTVEYNDFTSFRPTIRHPTFSSEELHTIRKRILVQYYSSVEYNQRVEEKIKRHPYFKDSFDEFAEHIGVQLGWPRARKM